MKKGTVTTEVTIGKAFTAFTTGMDQFTKVVAILNELPTQSADLSERIATQTDELNGLTAKFEREHEQNTYEFGVKLKNSKENAIQEVLKTDKKVAVFSADYESLQKDLKSTQTEIATSTQKAITDTTENLTKQHENVIALLNASFETKQAQSTSKIESLTSQTVQQKETIDKLYARIESMEKAETERAKANSAAPITVNTVK
jgi:hypothetical protein